MGKGNLFKASIGFLPIIISAVIMGLLFLVPVPEMNKEALLPLAGVVFGWAGTVINYEFGSSSAGRKTENKAT